MDEKELEMMKRAMQEDAQREGERFGCFATIAFALIFVLVLTALFLMFMYC